jgi:hypothetical protein
MPSTHHLFLKTVRGNREVLQIMASAVMMDGEKGNDKDWSGLKETGSTLLMDALEERQIEIMKFLSHHGADPRKTNHRGEDLYGFAARLNLSPYLREAGL